MKKLLSLGLILLTIVYALPLAYRAYYRGIDAAISQAQAVPAAKTTDTPVESTAPEQQDTAAAVPLPDSGDIRVLVGGEV